MNAIEFTEQAKTIFHKYFPNGYFRQSKLALGDGFCFTMGLIGSLDDVTNKIRQNDQMTISLFFHTTPYNTDEIKGKIVGEFSQYSLSVNPLEPFRAMSSVRLTGRKMNNSPDKVLVLFDKYMKTVHETVSEQRDAGNIYNQKNIPEKYLQF